MTAGALGEERPTLFLRKATGLVRGWSVRDSMIYACLATNFVTLGIYEFTFAGPAFPKGQMITAVVISGIWVSFLVVAYSGLVVTIPRAGGDYVWQTRILGSGVGFVMAATGWGFFVSRVGGPFLRQPFVVSVFGAALGDAQVDLARRWGGVVRHAQRDLHRDPDHDRAGRRPGLGGHGRLREDPALVLHRPHDRLRRRGDPAAGQLARQLRQLVQLRGPQALRHQQRLRGHQ